MVHIYCNVMLVLGLCNSGSVFAETLNKPSEDIFNPLAIYGEDNRQEPFDSTKMEFETSRSVAGRFSLDHLTPTGSGFIVQRNALGKEKCSSIRFAEQTLGPTCTGFLVKPDVLVTAGHCMNEVSKCTDSVWVFDYVLKKKGDQSYKAVANSNVYRCKKIIAQKYASFGNIDYALIQLDRPVLDREPLVLDLESRPVQQAPVYMIGHPSGLPLKVTTAGKVLRNEDLSAFDTDLDVFQGNSGSPVFDSLTGKVMGITSHGQDDYTRDGGAGCKIPRVCNPGDKCYLSTASRISNIAEEFKKLNSGSVTRVSSLKLNWPRRKGVVLYKLKENLQLKDTESLFKSSNHVSLGSNIFEAHFTSVSVNALNSKTQLETEEDFAAKMKASGLVEFAEPDYAFLPDMVVTDPIAKSQWYLDKVGLPSAWDVSTGNGEVSALVCDTGIQSNHADIKENVFLDGRNFVDNSTLTEPSGNPHGTLVSGLIGARGNNNIGIAGVSWRVKIIPGKITNEAKGLTLTSNMVKCIQWAIDNKIRLVNLSYNGGGSEAITEVAKSLYDHNGLLVFTIGNTSEEVAFAPNPYAIRVGASDSYDFKSYFSNTGLSLDIVAPGVSMYSTDSNGDYKRVQGTSFSAPMVTGTAVLLLSIDPSLTALELRNLILDSAKDLGTKGFDKAYGHGRLDIDNAIKLLKERSK